MLNSIMLSVATPTGLLVMTHRRKVFELFEFISAEDDDRFYLSLSEIDDPNELNLVHQVYTPLGFACNFDRRGFVRALLEKGASVNCRTGSLLQAPVHFASKGDNKGVKCMQLLYEFGANLSEQDGNRDTPLHHACSMENVLLFDFLMANGANVNAVNAESETPLIRAIVSQNEYFIERLISAGCDVNLPNGDPLDYLIRQQPAMTDCIDLLINSGADIHRKQYLHTAAANNNIAMMRLLKDGGVDLHSVMAGMNEFTALHCACESTRASYKVVELLLEWGLNVNATSMTFNTPLHLACQNCHLKKVLLLVNYGADVTARNTNLYTPLIALLMRRIDKNFQNFYKIFSILIASGSPITNCDLDIFNKIVPVSLRRVKTNEEICAFLKAIHNYVCRPRRLMNLCRSTVLFCLAAKVDENIAALPLPVYLQEFLMYKDILGHVNGD